MRFLFHSFVNESSKVKVLSKFNIIFRLILTNYVAKSTEHFTYLDKLHFLMGFNFRLEPIYTIAPSAFKNNA
jgi:hypothetical protein